MSKPLVVILSIADWAGSQYQAYRAIDSAGEFECRHISMYTHPYEFPSDIFLPVYPKTSNDYELSLFKKSFMSFAYQKAAEQLQKADIIHLWNTYPGDGSMLVAGLPVDFKKIKVVTMTGSMYRDNHTDLNQLLRELGHIKLIVQNPNLKFSAEIDSTFIPHAVDTDFFKPVPFEERGKTVGGYRAMDMNPVRPSDKDLKHLSEVIKKFPEWSVDLDYSQTWHERMELLPKCGIFIQDLSPHMGYWGRSALEACAFGIPTISNYSSRAIQNSEGKLGSIPIVNTKWDDIGLKLKTLIEDDLYRKDVGEKSRKWIENHFSYPVVGGMYSEVYRKALSEI